MKGFYKNKKASKILCCSLGLQAAFNGGMWLGSLTGYKNSWEISLRIEPYIYKFCKEIYSFYLDFISWITTRKRGSFNLSMFFLLPYSLRLSEIFVVCWIIVLLKNKMKYEIFGKLSYVDGWGINFYFYQNQHKLICLRVLRNCQST